MAFSPYFDMNTYLQPPQVSPLDQLLQLFAAVGTGAHTGDPQAAAAHSAPGYNQDPLAMAPMPSPQVQAIMQMAGVGATAQRKAAKPKPKKVRSRVPFPTLARPGRVPTIPGFQATTAPRGAQPGQAGQRPPMTTGFPVKEATPIRDNPSRLPPLPNRLRGVGKDAKPIMDNPSGLPPLPRRY